MATVTMEVFGQQLQGALGNLGVQTKLLNCVETPTEYRFDFSRGAYHTSKLKNAMDFLNNRDGLEYVKNTSGGFVVTKPKDERDFVNYYQTQKPIRDAIAGDINGKQKCYLCFGQGSDGYFVKNLQDCAHVLIAGTTGSGKSVLLNSLIVQLYKFSDAYLRLIDPKGGCELGLYENYARTAYEQHERIKVAKTNADAIATLKSTVATMEARYSAMGYNKTYSGKRFVVVIDELADLMMTSKAEVEDYIIRIAQKGRAAGVHLIIATQDPRANVVTGLIKYNLPTKVCLKTANARHSMNVIDIGKGANLLDKGDALIKTPAKPDLFHIQCPMVTDATIRNIISKRTD